MAHGEGNVAHISCLVIEGPCLPRRGKNAHSCLAFDIVLHSTAIRRHWGAGADDDEHYVYAIAL